MLGIVYSDMQDSRLEKSGNASERTFPGEEWGQRRRLRGGGGAPGNTRSAFCNNGEKNRLGNADVVAVTRHVRCQRKKEPKSARADLENKKKH